MDYHRKHAVDTRIMRIFNTYGPKMDTKDGRVVSNFIVQALRGEDITVYGDGSQTRSFCYVSDLLDGMMALMNYEGPYPAPVNIGNPGEFSMLELAEEVIRLTGTQSKIVHKDLPKDDPKQRQPNIAKAKVLLGWEPQIKLEQGLVKTIDYFKAVLYTKELGVYCE
jgi:UDP-glucuronate decarboxylase